jgi:hypothetical protein
MRTGMTGFSTGSFFLVFENFFAVASPKGGGLSGTGSLLLFQLFTQQAIFGLQGRNGLLQFGNSPQQCCYRGLHIIHDDAMIPNNPDARKTKNSLKARAF